MKDTKELPEGWQGDWEPVTPGTKVTIHPGAANTLGVVVTPQEQAAIAAKHRRHVIESFREKGIEINLTDLIERYRKICPEYAEHLASVLGLPPNVASPQQNQTERRPQKRSS